MYGTNPDEQWMRSQYLILHPAEYSLRGVSNRSLSASPPDFQGCSERCIAIFQCFPDGFVSVVDDITFVQAVEGSQRVASERVFASDAHYVHAEWTWNIGIGAQAEAELENAI